MTPGWQECCYGIALVLFVLAALASWVGHRAWPALIGLGLALFALVAVWNAAAAN